MEAPDFWDKPNESKTVLQRRRQLERRVDTLKKLRSQEGDLEAWQESCVTTLLVSGPPFLLEEIAELVQS